MAETIERHSVVPQDRQIARRRAGSRDELGELRRRNDELAEALAARDRFLSVAAHELRNPMTSMYLRVQQLVNTAGSAGADKQDRMIREIERLEHLMAHYIKRATMLLDVSRVAAGKITLEPVPVDFAALLRDAVEEVRPAAQHAGSQLTVDIPDELRGVWDRLAVEQVIENILSNAVKFGAGQAIEISLGSASDTVSLRVRDHGIGMSKLDQTHLFERFRRGQGAQQHIGFGVGLWLVSELVEAMGGRISIVSATETGSTFTVTLPLTPIVPNGAPARDRFGLNG
jgi:signal transduction histidine kinase